MKAFVTGATGLLGNNLLRSLEAAGHEVVTLARDSAKAARVLAGTSARIVVGDMLRVEEFAAELSGCDVVFHTAAYFREAFEPGADNDALDTINIGGTMALLAAADAAAVPCFVHVSSGGVIGRKSDGSAGDEDTPPLPLQRQLPYFRSKLKGDAAIAAWKSRSGIAIVEILPGWIWGPWDAAPTAAGRIVAEFTNGKIPACISGGTSVVDARDVAFAMVAAASRAIALRETGTTIHRYVVGGTYCSMREIMEHLETATGAPAPRFDAPFLVLLAYAYAYVFWSRLTGGTPLVTPTAVRTMNASFRLDSSKAARELGLTFRELLRNLGDSVEWQDLHAPSPGR